MDAIALEQQGIRLGIGQIVDRHQFEIVIIPFQDRTRHKASDTPESVDRNFGSHIKYSL